MVMRRLSPCTCSRLAGDDQNGAWGSLRERAAVVEVSRRGARSLIGRVETLPRSRSVSALSMGTLACVVAALALGGPARADCISQTVSTTTIHNCDGKLSTSHTVGSTTIHNIDGRFGVSQRVGDVTIHSGPLFTAPGESFGTCQRH